MALILIEMKIGIKKTLAPSKICTKCDINPIFIDVFLVRVYFLRKFYQLQNFVQNVSQDCVLVKLPLQAFISILIVIK